MRADVHGAGLQVLVAEAWCPVSGKAPVQRALRQASEQASATVRPLIRGALLLHRCALNPADWITLAERSRSLGTQLAWLSCPTLAVASM